MVGEYEMRPGMLLHTFVGMVFAWLELGQGMIYPAPVRE